MHKLFKRIIGTLEIGGGFLGIVLIFQMIFSSDVTLGKIIIGIIFIALYFYGILSGVLLFENHRKGIYLSKIFYLMQIPFIWFSIFGFQFVSGFHAYFFLKMRPIGVGGNFQLGSLFNINLLYPQENWVVGVNIFALAIFAYLTNLQDSISVPEDYELPNIALNSDG